MTRRRGRVDFNQPEIVQALRDVGAQVTSMADLGNGVSDLLVSFRGEWTVMEIKDGTGKLTPDERAWIEDARAPVTVVRSVDDALRAIGAIR